MGPEMTRSVSPANGLGPQELQADGQALGDVHDVCPVRPDALGELDREHVGTDRVGMLGHRGGDLVVVAAPPDPDAVGDVQSRCLTTLLDRADDLPRDSGPAKLVVEGEVRIEGNDLPPLVLGERSVAGIIDVLADRARTRDGVVTKDAHLLELPSEEWLNVLEDDAEFARGALRNAARGAHAALLALVPDGGFPEAPEHEATPDLPALHLVERMLVLRSSPLVQRASAQALEELAETAKELRLEPGETLFERGDGVGRFCFVAHGTIALERDEPRIAARFGPGSLVGGVAAVTLDTEAYRAHAVTRAVVLDVDHDDLFDVVEEHFDLGRSLIVMVALENERLRSEETAKALGKRRRKFFEVALSRTEAQATAGLRRFPFARTDPFVPRVLAQRAVRLLSVQTTIAEPVPPF